MTSTPLLTLMALSVSLVALIYLRNTDPKRRRVFRLKPWETRRYDKLAWLISFLPGLFLLIIQNMSALILWFAAFSLLGWFVALVKPISFNKT